MKERGIEPTRAKMALAPACCASRNGVAGTATRRDGH